MLIPVELSKIIIDEKRQDQIVVLKEKGGRRQFPIVIGFVEASSIKMKLAGIKTPRPLTHDLLMSVIEGLGAKMERLIIDALANNTFYAKLALRAADGTERLIDSRPSDGLALVVRAKVPIFVEETVLNQATLFKPE